MSEPIRDYEALIGSLIRKEARKLAPIYDLEVEDLYQQGQLWRFEPNQAGRTGNQILERLLIESEPRKTWAARREIQHALERYARGEHEANPPASKLDPLIEYVGTRRAMSNAEAVYVLATQNDQ